MPSPYYTASTLKFLSALALNNHREWFSAHQADYEDLVREPSLRLIRDAQPLLRRLAPHFEASDRKQGGSLMRVNRDTRFSKDKSPYKTNIGIQFRHAVGKDAHAPGFYLHIAPDRCFLGVGIWHPEPPVLDMIRCRIIDKPRRWAQATRDQGFSNTFDLAGDSLTRPPRGFDADHPAIADLMRKDHIAVSPLSQRDLFSTNLVGLAFERFGRSRWYLRFLCEALGLPM
jgi:uncharacterized protein (TIGR02453 family)